jgi:probable F420-dependent oxidoreductase
LSADLGSDLVHLALHDPAGWLAELRTAEDLGFEIVALSDHLHGQNPSLDPWTALAYAAAGTERIQLLTDVLGLPYREPAALAKMAETLTRLSRGRVILGLGNGGYDAEFAAFGLPVRSARAKVDALGEAVHIIRSLWQHPSTTYAGQHFRLDQASLAPRPEHTIPIWLGSYGPRGLRQVGQLADGWLPSVQRLGLEAAVTGLASVRAAARAADRDPSEITIACNFTVDETPQRSVSELAALVRAGFTTIIIAGLNGARDRQSFATNVIPAVQRLL